jgi:hypothetical protein
MKRRMMRSMRFNLKRKISRLKELVLVLKFMVNGIKREILFLK